MNIKIDNPCNENWNEMTLDAQGRFCNQCAKSVIDFTKLTDKEVISLLSKSKEEMCGRLTSTQLKTPYIHFPEPKESRIPYSKIAANVFLVASALSAQSCTTPENGTGTEIHRSVNDTIHEKLGKVEISKVSTEAREVIMHSEISGTILSPHDSFPIINAKVEFISIYRVYTAHTDSLGRFTLSVPNEFIQEQNVIRTSYREIVQNPQEELDKDKNLINSNLLFLKSEDYVLSKEQLQKSQTIIANYNQIFKGFGHYIEPETESIVLKNGIKVDYNEFQKARRGEKSSCNLANKDYYYFSGEHAIALYGAKAKNGLYLFFE